MVLVATVNPQSGTTPPTGTVDFTDGTTDLGAIALSSYQATAYAILFARPMGPGTHTIIAHYAGDNTFTPAAAGPNQIAVATQ